MGVKVGTITENFRKLIEKTTKPRVNYVILFLTSSLMLVAISSATMADPLLDASIAYQRGDYETARRLLRPLAEQGDAFAQYKLGEMYATGKGVRQDYTAAAKLYRLAAEQGDPDGQELLGLLYDVGAGVPRDYVQAHMWLNLAASRYLASEVTKREVAVEAQDLVASKMTPEQVAEAQKLAREWKPKPER
jgi:uncharacterized protein